MSGGHQTFSDQLVDSATGGWRLDGSLSEEYHPDRSLMGRGLPLKLDLKSRVLFHSVSIFLWNIIGLIEHRSNFITLAKLPRK